MVLSILFLEAMTTRSFENILHYFKDSFYIFLIFGVISSYQLTKGKLDGIANTQKIWKNWIHTNEHPTKVETIEDPPLSSVNKSITFLNRMKKIGLTILRNPSRFVIHYVCWFSGFIISILLDESIRYEVIEEGIHSLNRIIDRVISDMSTDFYYATVACVVLTYVTCFQYAKGKHNGILSEQQQWSDWYANNTDSFALRNALESPPSLIKNDYGELLLTRNPIYTILHTSMLFVFLFLLCVQLMLITNWSGIQILTWFVILILFLH